MCICDYVKNRIDTCKKCVFRFEKGYKRMNVLDSCKAYCWCSRLRFEYVILSVLNLHLCSFLCLFPTAAITFVSLGVET